MEDFSDAVLQKNTSPKARDLTKVTQQEQVRWA